jgi:hypothetical protein
MPIFNVRAPDGSLLKINGPEDATDEELIQIAERNYQPKKELKVSDYLKDIPKAVGRGATGLLETSAVGASALLPEEYEQAARKGITGLAEPAKKYLAPSSQEVGESVSSQLASGVGSTLPFFLLGPAGALGRAAGAGLGVAAGAGEARQAAEAKGATPEERRLATQLGAPTGLLDILAPQITLFKGVIGNALARGGVEGATEAAQKIAQNLIARGVYDPKQDVLAGSGEEGAYGAGVGALTSLIVDLTLGRRGRTSTATPSAAPITEAVQPEQPAPQAPTGGLSAERAAELRAEADAEAAAKAPKLALGMSQPFTPVDLPDGSVALTQQDLDSYEREQFEKKYAPQPSLQEVTQPQIPTMTRAGATDVASMQGFAGAANANSSLLEQARQRKIAEEKQKQKQIKDTLSATFSADPIQNEMERKRRLDELGYVPPEPKPAKPAKVAKAEKEKPEITPSPIEQKAAEELPPPNEPFIGESGKPVVLQNRDRSSDDSIRLMNNIANKPNYNKARASYNFTEGAPVVVTDIDIPAQQLGKTAIATTAGEREIPIQYAVVDADQVLTSNDINGSVNPAYTDQSISAIRAVAGNGRLTGLVNSYQRGKSQQYRSSMEADADHEINPDVIKGMKNPILVRVMPKSEVTADIGDVSNTSGITDLTAVEQAKNDANRIDLRALSFDEDGGLSNKAYYDFIKAMPESEQGKMMTNGKPSQAAKTRLNNAVFWSAYGNEELISLYAESTDPEAKNILNALASAAPYMQAVKGTVGDVRGPTVEAAISAVNATRAGLSLEKYASTPDFTVSDEARKLIDYFAQNSRSGKRIGEKLRSIASIGFEEANKPEQDLMGEVPKKSISQIIDDGLKEEENQTLFSLNKESKPIKTTPKELKMQKDLEGKSMVQAAQYLITNAPDSFQKFVAKKVLNVMQEMQARGVDLHFEVQTGNTRNSKLYNAEGLTTHIFGKEGRPLRINLLLNGAPVFENQRGYPSGLSYKTLMHEMLHAATSAKIYYLSDTSPAVKELNDLYKLVAEEYKKQRRDGTLPEFLKRFNNGLNNALDNSNEMLTWSMTDKDMQQWMNSIKVGDKTVFSKIIDLIRQVLGISKPFETALDRLVRTTDSLLDMDIQVLEDGVISKGHTFGKREPSKKMPSYQQTLFSKRAQQLFMEDELTNKLQFGKKEEPTPTGNGQASLDNLTAMGRGVAAPESGYIAKIRESWDNARDNPTATAEAARSSFQRFRDRIETYAFSSDAALNNAIRREIIDSGLSQQEKIGLLLNTSLSQTVHSDAVASMFLQRGGITYDKNLHKWVGVDNDANFVTLSKQLDAIAEKNGLTKPQIELIAHAAFEAKRTQSLIKFNEELTAKIAEVQSEAASKRKSSPVAASALSEKAQRMKDEFKYIHLDAGEIAAGMRFFQIHPELNEVVKTWNKIRDNAADVLKESGLWSEADAEFLLSNADYVPFYREDQLENGQGPKEFIRGLKVQAKERKLKGSDKPVNDIFDNQVRWVQYSINRAVRNRSAIALADTAVSVGAAKQVASQKDGANVTRIWRDGKEEYYDMADPMFMEAFNGLEAVVIPSWKWASTLANTLRQSVVMYPLFSVAQVPQDSFAAMFSSGLKPQYALRIPFLAVKEFIQTLRGASKSHQELKNIGAVGVRDFTSAMVRQDAEIFAGLRSPPGFLGKLKYGLNHIAMAADNAVRQAVFEAAESQGLSKAEAFEKSFEVFNVRRKGSSKTLALASQLIPFFNAYLAAQSVAYKTITGRGTSPQDRVNALQTFAATTASVMTMSLLYSMLNGDDDDYLKKPAVQRDRLLMIPGTGGMSIPLRSDLFTMPKIITEHMYLLMTDKGYEDGRKFRESMTNALANSLLSPTAVPQAIKPIIEVAWNRDFFQGRPLIGTYQQKLETERQFTDSTSELGKFIGSSGLISPIAVDHLIRGMFGSVGGLTLYMTSAMLDNNPEAPRPSLSMQDAIATLPGMSGFVAKTYENSLKRDFYALKEEVDKSVNTFNDIKKRSPEQIPEFLAQEENIKRLGLQKSVNKIAENLSTIRDSISRITNANMPPEQKQQQIEALRNIENQMLKGVDVKRLREMGMM